MTRYTHGIATASWIDKAVRLQVSHGPALPFSLPKNDGTGPSPLLTRAFFRACQGFRFANFLEVGVEVENGTIVKAGFTPESRGYFADSFLGSPSHDYPPRRTLTIDGAQRVFTQVVGARTIGQEEVGGLLGRLAATIASGGNPFGGQLGQDAGKGAARAATPFAPIWSELEIRLAPDGQATSRLKRFSLFPSLTYYEQETQTSDALVATLHQKPLAYGPARYDAGQEAMTSWFASGWGGVRGGTLGPTPGNPWGVENDGKDTAMRPAA